MILWPSIRSIAYLDVMNKLNYFPNEIIVLNNGFTLDKKLLKEADKYDYRRYINFDLDIGKLIDEKSIFFKQINETDINSDKVIDLIKKMKNKYILYSGGGILRNEILSLSKRFIHIHPGIIPKHRGSTCFYYSLLENYLLGATAYFMNEKIDAGEIIIQREFSMNYLIKKDQSLFIDYILDSYIRAHLLKSLINLFSKADYFETKVTDCTNNQYYIMHPLLRHIAITKINNNYSSSIKTGLIKN